MIFDYFKAKRLENELTNHVSGFSGLSKVQALVDIAKDIRALPKKTVPIPTMRFSYLSEIAESPIAHGLRLVNFISYFSGTALAFGLVIVMLVASSSKPGSTFYAYRTQGQLFRLHLVNNDTTRAELQLAYAETTLRETQTVLNSDATGEAKAAALSDLSSKTETTVKSIQKYAVEKNDSGILNKLETLTNKQAEVISQVSGPEVKDAVKSALAVTEAGSKTIAEAKRLVATSNESALAKLQDTVQTVSGNITKIIDATTFQIDKDTLVLTKDTTIHDSAGVAVLFSTLKVGQKVTVKAVKLNDVLTAQGIVQVVPGKVKDAQTEHPVPTGVNLNSNTDLVPDASVGVQSGFLVEDPTPQYK